MKSFLKANVANAQLHIYGDGNYREQLEKICEKYSQIVYCGVCPKKVIEEKEREATLLVNPRTSDGEYTKYSFPSKTMEYMLSGTPVVMTRLPGLPQEYYKYLFLFEEETVDGYAQTLKVLLEMDPSELQRRGMAAQRFVLDNKNKEIQAKKIVSDLKYFNSNVLFFPKREIAAYDYVAESKDLPYERIDTLNKIHEQELKKENKPIIIVTGCNCIVLLITTGCKT